MFKACIFDLDGTLVNSLADLAASTNYALSRQGYPTYETDRYRYFVGNGVPRLIETVLPEQARTPEILKKTRSLFDEYYHGHAIDHTAPYKGIPELLETLRRKKLKLAVVSNKPDGFVKQIVRSLFGGTFDVIFGMRPGVPRKPDPAGPLEACSVMGVKPEECLYLGDSGVDMLTAKAAGMFGVGALWGFREKDELVENGAKALADAPSDVLGQL